MSSVASQQVDSTAERDAAPAPLPPYQYYAVWAASGLAVFLVCTTLAGDVVRHVAGHDNLFGLLPMFDLRVEGNIASFFGAVLLLAVGVVAASIAVVRDGAGRGRFRAHWRALAAVFTLLAVDEAAGVHELLNAPLRELYRASGALYFPWVVPYGALTLVFAVLFWPFLHAFGRWFRVRIAAAGILYVAGALGMEAIQGLRYTVHGPDPTYFTIWLAGEILEMAGAILFLYVLVRYLATLRTTTP